VQGVANQFGDVGLPEVVFFASCLDAGEIENVVDQSGEPLALLANDAVVLLVLLLAAEATHLQRLRVQPDQRQGGAQLVRDIGEKVGLQPGQRHFPVHVAVSQQDSPGEQDGQAAQDE